MALPQPQPLPLPTEPAALWWCDGRIVHRSQISVDLLSHSLHYGSGVFEGIRAYETAAGTAVFRLREHCERLVRSAQTYALDLDYSAQDLELAIVNVIRENHLGGCYIRPLVFWDASTLHLAPDANCQTRVFVAARPLGKYFGADRAVRACISKWRKYHASVLPPTVKCTGHYANSVLATREAVARGFDEAILLNRGGDVAEGAGENVFVVKDGVLRTNDVAASILPGITRATVLDLAHQLGIPAIVGRLTVADLFTADEVFFTGTAVEVTAVSELEDHRYPEERPVTRALARAYTEAALGQRDPRYCTVV